jgi:hypothetical protein
MIDDHTTPPILKGKNLEELQKERLASKPDEWTLSWWNRLFDEVLKAYRGACHAINLAVVNTRESLERVDLCEKRMKEMEEDNQALMAKIGELQAENVLASKRMDDMASWASRIEKDLRKFQHKNQGDATTKP